MGTRRPQPISSIQLSTHDHTMGSAPGARHLLALQFSLLAVDVLAIKPRPAGDLPGHTSYELQLHRRRRHSPNSIHKLPRLVQPKQLLVSASLGSSVGSSMALREIESTLPPGFRFYPSDEELVCHYLHNKVAGERTTPGTTLVEVDLHAREPWELPEVAKLTASEWYFFSFRDRKYATGSRTNRATKTGYWKATGKDREVRGGGGGAPRAVVGMRKTLVFYQGRAPNGVKTGWVMHEFRLDTPHSPPREDWVLCRVFQKAKGDGDGQDAGAASSSPTLGSSSSHSHVMELDHPAAGGGYFGPGVGPQQEVPALTTTMAMLPHHGGTVADHHQIFPQCDAGGAPPGFGPATRQGAAGDECGFGFFDMGGFDDDMANLGLGGIGFPQGWH
ncbi:hypothetical protein ACP70R_027438 [Stipagrostis hirtigluma subsp. patula]